MRLGFIDDLTLLQGLELLKINQIVLYHQEAKLRLCIWYA